MNYAAAICLLLSLAPEQTRPPAAGPRLPDLGAGRTRVTVPMSMLGAGPVQQRREPVTFFSILDANRDGVVTRAEIAEAEANPMKFQLSGLQTAPVFDALKRSTLTEFSAADFDRTLMEFSKSVQRSKRAEAFKDLDVDGDGTISVAEVPREFRPLLEELLSMARMPLDSRITLEELDRIAKVARLAPPKAAPRVPAAFQLIDLNRDGFIQPAELVDIVDRLAKLDTDGDDKLSLNEFLGPESPDVPPTTGQKPEPNPPAANQPRQPKPEPLPAPRLTPAEKFAADFFAKFDTDKNGKLTAAEIPERASSKIGKLDYNGDGAISRSELIEGLSSPNP